MTSIEESLLVERRGAALWLTFNRPDALNAFDGGVLRRLHAALGQAADDPGVRAVVLTGAGRAFSAGQDVRELRAAAVGGDAGAAVAAELRERYAPVVLGIRRLPVPVIAALNGVTAGAAFGLALACDLRVAATGATFAVAPYRVGLMPAVGISYLLPAVVGWGRASALTLLEDRIDAQRALEVGIVERVTGPDDLVATVDEIVARIATLPAQAVAATKAAFDAAALPDLAAHLEREAVWQAGLARSADHREGLAALREKRATIFAREREPGAEG
jgi:2-(1,2-epoxy-1,2-dihydrophenyl)acetyl-CoA isomerase